MVYNKRFFLLASVAFVLFYLSEPPSGYVLLIPIAFLIVFYILEKAKMPYIWLFSAALLKSLISASWLIKVSVISWIGVSIYLAFWWGAFGISALFFTRKHIPPWIYAPPLWMVLEYIRSFGSLAYPWMLLGYSLDSFPLYRQMADTVGVYGLSFYLVLISALVYSSIKQRSFRLGIMLIPLVIIPPFYGAYRIQLPIKGEKINVAVLQGNLNSRVRWDLHYAYKSFKRYRELLNVAVQKKTVNWVILPETAVPYYILDKDYFDWLSLFTNLAKYSKQTYLFGLATQVGDMHYNSVAYIEEKGVVQGIYSKRRLVPFGEFVPFEKNFPFLRRFVPHQALFNKGKTCLLLKPDKVPIASFICYEIIFSDLVRDDVNKGAAVIVNFTNDIWFGKSVAPFQHAVMAKFRAIENGRYLIRSANSGISFIIDPYGNVQTKTKLFEKTVMYGDFFPIYQRTIYSSIGTYIFPCGIVLLFFATLFSLGSSWFSIGKFRR